MIDNYNIEDDDEAPAWDGSSPHDSQDDGNNPKQPSGFGLLIKMLTSPVDGWKQIKRSKITFEHANSSCLYPLLAIASACKFSTLFYNPNVPLTNVIIDALVTFTSFFLSLYAVILLARIILPKKSRAPFDTNYGRNYISFSLSSLALFSIPYELLPMLEPLLVFLPLWTIYAMTRGIRFMRVPKSSETTTSIILALLTVGVPVGLGWIFDILLKL